MHGFAEREDEARALIALSLAEGVGPGRLRALVSRFGAASAVLGTSARLLATVPGIGPRTAAAIAGFDDWDRVDEQQARAERCGAVLVEMTDPRFPYLLRQIYDPPAFLWLRGHLPEARPDARVLAIVGTRRATDYGRRLAREYAGALVEAGFTVVSGLAYGIDTAAHTGAVEAGGVTYAVLGSGVDRVYPSRNARLAEAILEQGALLSEYPLGAEPDAPNFPRRNRVVSGLALGTLVVEAHATGGALITARLAVEQNREVFALPGSAHSRASDGTHRLIRDGHARLVTAVDDILEELGMASGTAPQQQASGEAAAVAGLNGPERRLYETLTSTPVHIDALCHQTGLDVSSALVYLLSLEFKGLVRQMAGKQFFRA